MAKTVTGYDETALNHAIIEHFDVGRKLALDLDVDRALTAAELQGIHESLLNAGAEVHNVTMRSKPYPYTVRVVFTRPSIAGYGFVGTLAVVAVVGLLLAVGAGIFAWRITDIIQENFLPMLVIGGGLAALFIYTSRRPVPTGR